MDNNNVSQRLRLTLFASACSAAWRS